MAKLVSKTYGEALFELAMEENRAQEMLEEIEKARAQNQKLSLCSSSQGESTGGLLL